MDTNESDYPIWEKGYEVCPVCMEMTKIKNMTYGEYWLNSTTRTTGRICKCCLAENNDD